MLDKAPSFASIAVKIGDLRLEKALEELAPQAAIDTHNTEFMGQYHRRSDVRKAVKQLKAETKRFQIALNRVSQHLLELTIDDNDRLILAQNAVRDITALCEQALSRISPKGGTKKEPARVICAAIVVEAWTLARRKAPSASNKTLQQLCDDYWQACGQNSLGDPRNWLRSIFEALSDQSAMRRYIRDAIRRSTE
jgi:hypothetical protein